MYICTENYSERDLLIKEATTEIITQPELFLRAFYIPTRIAHELLRTNAKKGLSMSHYKFKKESDWKLSLAREINSVSECRELPPTAVCLKTQN